MEKLETYIAFDLEFNTVENQTHIIQVSAVKFTHGQEVDSFDTYVYTDLPLKSFINGLTGITSEHIKNAPKIDSVLTNFRIFVEDLPLIGYNAQKSDLPLLSENGLDLTSQYKIDVYGEAVDRRSKDLNGIKNLQLHTVASFLGLSGKSHNSLEDARMTAQVYEKFLEFDDSKGLLDSQETATNNPFGEIDFSAWFE